ncbi:MAG TPA: lysylphosphatidylglycerol synthase domain-containing protein [Sediminibacterium sp.]|nr:lysylphosphatidylglycerol synthase domain-containing protein [Sediminibacterium sp.]
MNYVLGPVLFLWLAYSIYQQVQNHKDLDQSWELIKQTVVQKGWMVFALVLVLMTLNWGLEARKWQLLASKVQPISYWSAYRAILSGQAFALNTINRSGDFLGRILYLEEGNRLRAVGLSLIGSMSQILVTFGIGFISLTVLRFTLLDNQAILPGLSVFWLDALLIGLVPGILLFGVLYFNVALFIKWMERIPFIRKYQFFIEKMETMHYKDLTRILLLSLLRYVVFVVQYVVLLKVFGVEASWQILVCLVSVLFMLMAMIPTIALAELGIRGKLSLELFGLVTTQQLSILAASAGIWIVNLIIPAILGTVFLLGLRLFKQKEQKS